MKMPVFTAFSASISYVAAHFLTLLRITWLPALLLMAVMTYVMPALSQAQLNMIEIESAGGDQAAVFAAMGDGLKSNAILLLASAIFYPMMIAGVLKHVVRGEAPRLPLYLSYGPDEFRVFVTYVLLIVMFMLAAIAGALGVTVIGVISALASQAVAGLVSLLLMLAFFAGIIWFMLRLSVAFAASVGERTVGIAKSWEATAGAGWSLLCYWLLWFLVFIVIGGVYAGIAAGEMFSLIPEMIASGGDEAAMREIEERIAQAQLNMYDISKPRYWTYAAATYAYTILSVALWTAAGGVAYRYLTGEERG
ncbi:hypothetical protein [Hyphococcus sp.]|uniref:hypothetical protein n=1 Tax=Hyphococcus sp. TaxID=2038636 RepID=UPI003CCBEBC3